MKDPKLVAAENKDDEANMSRVTRCRRLADLSDAFPKLGSGFDLHGVGGRRNREKERELPALRVTSQVSATSLPHLA